MEPTKKDLENAVGILKSHGVNAELFSDRGDNVIRLTPYFNNGYEIADRIAEKAVQQDFHDSEKTVVKCQMLQFVLSGYHNGKNHYSTIKTVLAELVTQGVIERYWEIIKIIESIEVVVGSGQLTKEKILRVLKGEE